MYNLKLNNKISLEGKTQTGQCTDREFDVHCSKYQLISIKNNRALQ
jgi:hypothetical protein